MAVEPEHVLEKNGIAPEVWIKNADTQYAFERDKSERDCQHRRGQDEDDTGAVHRPDEQRQTKPGHSRTAHFVDGHDEIEAGEDRTEPGDEDAADREDDVGIAERAAIWGIEGPTRIDAAEDQRHQGARSTDDEKIPTGKIQPRES